MTTSDPQVGEVWLTCDDGSNYFSITIRQRHPNSEYYEVECQAEQCVLKTHTMERAQLLMKVASPNG